MTKKIFLFDWSGTLDVLRDPKTYLKELRVRYPGCRIIVNTGLVNHNLDNMLGGELAVLFDDYYWKQPPKKILMEQTNHKDRDNSIEEPIPAWIVEEVLIVDDQNSLDADDCEAIGNRLGLPGKLKAFYSIKQMEEHLK